MSTYAIRLVGDALLPRVKSGECIVIDPDKPVAVGDEVVLTFTNGTCTMRELVLESADAMTFRNVSHDATVTVVPRTEIKSLKAIIAVHKGLVLGELSVQS